MAARPELVLGERGGRQEDQHAGCNNATRASPLTAGTSWDERFKYDMRQIDSGGLPFGRFGDEEEPCHVC